MDTTAEGFGRGVVRLVSYWDMWQLLALVQHELLLFAGVFFLIGALDDIAVDAIWLWLKARGRLRARRVRRTALVSSQLSGPIAVFIPAWREASVIGDTIAHMLAAWPQESLRVFVGCYPNDPQTIAVAREAAARALIDPRGESLRVRIIINESPGPTTKADCLNRLYRGLVEEEQREEFRFAGIIFHDAEDLVDPGALGLLDEELRSGADFVQLPVEPLVHPHSRWIGSHYCEEFAEAHAKAMVVRGALGAALPAAGVGCAISRRAMERLSQRQPTGVPFDGQSLTEDYELGLAIAEMKGVCRFVRARGEDGSLIATRAFFPARLDEAVRQKTRWVHGIALQGWDRVGWTGGPFEFWMRARDRRGPLTALVLAVGYALLILTGLVWIASAARIAPETELPPLLEALLIANLIAFAWRAIMRFGFTAREYGIGEGVRAVLRIPLANVIAIIAGRRAVMAYLGTLLGSPVKWDKTPHYVHPAGLEANRRAHEPERAGAC